MLEGKQKGGIAAHKSPSLTRVLQNDRRAAILRVAQEVFFELGYAAASMSIIASRLGGSKGTLYNYFENKSALFIGYVEDTCRLFDDEIFEAWPDRGLLRPSLKSISRSYIRYFVSETPLRTLRLVVSESQRFPELTRIYNQAGPANSRRLLAEKLAVADSRGLIATPDPETAARHFFALCKGGIYYDRLLNLVPPPPETVIDAEAEAVTTAFMRIYSGGNA